MGLACLRFDFAGRGASEGRLEDLCFSAQVDDLEAAVELLASLGTERLGLFGSSMGGAVALLTAARDERVVAIATLAAIGHAAAAVERNPTAIAAFESKGYLETVEGRLSRKLWDDAREHDILSAVRVLHAPLLVIHGENDDVVPVSDAHDIAATARNASLEIISGRRPPLRRARAVPAGDARRGAVLRGEAGLARRASRARPFPPVPQPGRAPTLAIVRRGTPGAPPRPRGYPPTSRQLSRSPLTPPGCLLPPAPPRSRTPVHSPPSRAPARARRLVPPGRPRAVRPRSAGRAAGPRARRTSGPSSRAYARLRLLAPVRRPAARVSRAWA